MVDNIVANFLEKCPPSLDISDKNHGDIIDKFMSDITTSLLDDAFTKVTSQMSLDSSNKDDAWRKASILMFNKWKDVCNNINNKHITIVTKENNGNDKLSDFVLDERAIMIMITQLPKELKDPILPIIDDLIYQESIDHPEYIKPKISKCSEPHPDIDINNFVPVEDIPEERLLAEFFNTLSVLGPYRSNGEYEDSNALFLYNRSNSIKCRLEAANIH